MVSLAKKRGAQALLTGDIGYHQALEARTLGLFLIDGGHFSTERKALCIFADRLKGIVKERGWDLTVEFWPGETDPLKSV